MQKVHYINFVLLSYFIISVQILPVYVSNEEIHESAKGTHFFSPFIRFLISVQI